MTRLIKIKCPNCNAFVQLNPDQKVAFCQYCGTQLLFDNEPEANTKVKEDFEDIYKELDEAIDASEADASGHDDNNIETTSPVIEDPKKTERKRIEFQKAVNKGSLNYFAAVSFAFVLLCAGIIGLLFSFGKVTSFTNMQPNNILPFLFSLMALLMSILLFSSIYSGEFDPPSSPDDIKIPVEMLRYEGKDAVAVENQLRALGFNNIQLIPLNDLLLRRKDGKVTLITCNGEGLTSEKWYDKNVTIVITYHSLKKSIWN